MVISFCQSETDSLRQNLVKIESKTYQTMSRYRGPRIRIIRRLKQRETLRGFTAKITIRKKTAGEHGRFRPKGVQFLRKPKKPRRKIPKYRVRLQEKQKLRFNYGVTESQLIKHVKQAKKSKGSTGEMLLQVLEMRLDNIVFRLGLAPTIPAARQLISHGHVLVNSRKVTIPSYRCQPKDYVSITSKTQIRTLLYTFLKQKRKRKKWFCPPHLIVNNRRLIGVIKSVVDRRWVGVQLKELLVVEYYSRKV
uniref:Small ribosomal subunit protein uS4c n=1 Tax=Xylochloris irregularis TaxID=480381 RepID=A0A097KMF6_9CHLO|nr:ribosomal protein S4 [Xylochloris irregularis]AIT94350.1 ribosomal protein S4 [Xylochloris irregularis]